MKYFEKFFVIILTIFYTNLSLANNLVVYINMDKIMNETIAGKSITQQLEKIHKKNIVDFKNIEDQLKNEEQLIISQKNIISEDQYVAKVKELRKKVEQYKKNRKAKINSLTKKRIEASKKLLKEINPILTNYSEEQGISMILPKKNVILAKTDLDITNKIIEITNTKIKSINLN